MRRYQRAVSSAAMVACAASAVGASAASAVGASAASAVLQAPSTAGVGQTVSVRATGLIAGRYALTLVADAHPVRGASCVARLSATRAANGGSVTLRGTIPRELTCYQGSAISLGKVATRAGGYHLVVAEPTAPAGFDARGSDARSALQISG
jgi:hypothetical protein